MQPASLPLQTGFAGCREFIELESGYSLPLSTDRHSGDFNIHIFAGVRLTHGGPGIFVTPDVSGPNQFRDVGVFVGPVPDIDLTLINNAV